MMASVAIGSTVGGEFPRVRRLNRWRPAAPCPVANKNRNGLLATIANRGRPAYHAAGIDGHSWRHDRVRNPANRYLDQRPSRYIHKACPHLRRAEVKKRCWAHDSQRIRVWIFRINELVAVHMHQCECLLRNIPLNCPCANNYRVLPDLIRNRQPANHSALGSTFMPSGRQSRRTEENFLRGLRGDGVHVLAPRNGSRRWLG